MSTQPIPRVYLLVTMAFALAWVASSTAVGADDDFESLKRQINLRLSVGWANRGVEPAPRASDRVFVRRVYLDLCGRVPTVEEVDTFLADGRDDQRRQLVDQLLRSEDHVQHFADTLDTLLMGRTEESKYVLRSKHLWRHYLEQVVRDNRPWNEVAAEIVLARPSEANEGAVWFLYERDNQHQAIAEAVAPALFGIRIECAQCHDHMVADEILQEHYWGLVAFFNRSQNKQTGNGPRVAETAIGGFSEFANLSGQSSPNRLSFLGAATVPEKRPPQDKKEADRDELYVAASTDGDPRIPKFSRRRAFAEKVLRDHPLVARAMVNRVWAILMGRGIVHPHDEMDSVHEPSHPELLGWLSADYAANGYDLRRLIRGIVLSDAYQLSSVRPDDGDDPASFAWYLPRPLTGEQLARSIQMVVRGSFRNDDSVVALVRRQFREVLPEENVTTVRDALFLSNNKSLHEYIRHSDQDDHLVPRLLAMPSDQQRAAALFAAAFGRPPEEKEAEAVVAHLSKRIESLPAAVEQVVWSLLTSAEFRFNH